MQIKIFSSISQFNKEDWNALAPKNHPFLDYDFLKALEDSQSINLPHYWKTFYFSLWENEKLSAALVAYEKYDSYGEFVFDFAWANFYRQNGLDYYPKLVVAIPFTPATGERILERPLPNPLLCKEREHTFSLLAKEGQSSLPLLTKERAGERSALLQALLQFTYEKNYSGVHFLFQTQEETELLEDCGFQRWLGFQFHWKNKNFKNFEDYLATLHHKRRRQIIKERQSLAQQEDLQIEILEGEQISSEHLQALWSFCSDTFLKKSGDLPYLTEDFFRLSHHHLRQNLLLVLAKKNKEYIAGSFNLKKGSKLYGRYWGCKEHISNLHFECCYYQLIEYAIRNHLEIVEAGAQGEQKFFRGFEATETFSAHYFTHPEVRKIFGQWVEEQNSVIAGTIEKYRELSPIKKLNSSNLSF